MLEFFDTTCRKARKEHKCQLCGEVISKGETYVYETGKYDGDFFARHLHPECKKMIDACCDFYGENEYTEDGVYEYISEEYCYDCVHGQRQEDDCEVKNTFRCPEILRKLKEACQ